MYVGSSYTVNLMFLRVSRQTRENRTAESVLEGVAFNIMNKRQTKAAKRDLFVLTGSSTFAGEEAVFT